MQFIHETPRSLGGVKDLENTLSRALMKHSRVLWLVCGGSSIPKIAATMHGIPSGFSAKLHVMLTDERYGKPGHQDSNYQQLADAGFDVKQGEFLPALQSGLSLEQTAAAYAERFQTEAAAAGFIIATFGIGPDSHIAGILPHSAAATAKGSAAGYDAGQFKRLTLTFPALKRIDIAYAFAYGTAKKPALSKLKDTDAALIDQPCQILKLIPESYVYNDSIA
ncbi:MAG TPA: 6-phosphogluconolactonase [Candidatus Saccharimonadales bacterium]|nr:6-phosphogluconolactonase [Candidatus Saccharimonadales bacterium]